MRAITGQIAFGPFCLDTEVPRLLRDGLEIEIRPQALHALRTLVRASGRCVDYQEMIADAWHSISVSRHTVAVTVGEVKKALKEHGGWISYHPKLGYRLDIPQSEDLIRNGWHHWQRHTREGFEKALCCFQKAAQGTSTDFRAFEGIARTYLMQATFGIKPPRETYPSFLEAHRRAVETGGWTPELRADRAQGLHIFELKFEEAEAELLKALDDNPRVASVHIRLAVLYGTSMRRFDDALTVLERAYRFDGLWPILPCAEVLVRCCRGEYEQAIECGRKAVDLHPYFPFARSHYGQALELSGRYQEALSEYRLAAIMSPECPRFRAEEADCLIRLGRKPEAKKIAAELEDLRKREYLDSYLMAVVYCALGRSDQAIDELERADTECSPYRFMLNVDPRINALRGDPRFIRLRNRMFPADQSLKTTETAPGVRRNDNVIPPWKPKPSPVRQRVAS